MQVQNCYRIKKAITGGVEVSTARLKELHPKTFISPVQEAAEYTARVISDAERKLLTAVDAKEKEERLSEMLDDAKVKLEFAQGVYDICKVLNFFHNLNNTFFVSCYFVLLFNFNI